MRLWSDEIEAMRPEAEAVCAAGLAAMAAARGSAPMPTDVMGRVRQSRDEFDQMIQVVPEGENTEIAGVPCRVFRTNGPARGVLLHFHGGGMILGRPEMNDRENLARAERGIAVVSVRYRLAPEHPFPAGPDDGVAVASWLVEHAASEFGSAKLLIGGESAGGYMAAAVLLRVRDELGRADAIRGANLVFGVFDWGDLPSHHGHRPTMGGDMLDPNGIVFFNDMYLPGRTPRERQHPSISPAWADLHGLPPALFSVGTADHLLDDTMLMWSRYGAAGNDVELFVAPGMPHGFMAFPCGITRAWAQRQVEWFDERLA
jgi:acetyl esterase/lipase